MANPFDQFDTPAVTANPFDQFDAPIAKEPSWYEKLGRQAALTGRGVVGGIASTLDIPAALASAATRGINAVTGANIPVVNPRPMQQSYEQLFNVAGLPQAESPTERVVQSIIEGASGAGGTANVAQHLARVATTPIAKGVLASLATAPRTQAISGATSAGAGQLAAEMGAGQGAQTLASLVGGTVPLSPTMARNLLRAPEAEAGTRQAQVVANAREAHDAGYLIPPHQVSPTVATDILESQSGKKIEQIASVRNADVSTRLAKEDLGVHKNDILDENTYNKIRKEAGEAYKAISKVKEPVKADDKFIDEIQALKGTNAFSAQILGKNPELDRIVKLLTESPEPTLGEQLGISKPKKISFSTNEILEGVKTLRKMATANLKSIGDNAPANQAVGAAQRKAADSLDDLLERNLQHLHLNKDEVENYRKARQLIAKSHAYEEATNTTTGNVSARVLARLKDKDVPLTGNADKIARFGKAFPKSAQDADKLGSVTDSSALETIAAALAVGASHPLTAGAILSRPLTRQMQLTKPYQEAIFTPKETLPLGGLMQTFKPSVAPIPVSQLMQNTQNNQ